MKKNKDIWIFIISTILFSIISITMISAFIILQNFLIQTKTNETKINQLEINKKINKTNFENNPEKTFSGDPLITPAPEIE